MKWRLSWKINAYASHSCTLGGTDGLHAVCLMGEWWVFTLCLGVSLHFRQVSCGFGAVFIDPWYVATSGMGLAVLVWYAWYVDC